MPREFQVNQTEPRYRVFPPSILDLFSPNVKSLDIKRGRVHVNLRMAICVSARRLDSTVQARIEITNVAWFLARRRHSRAPRESANVTRWQVDAWYVPTPDRARRFVHLYSRERERGSIDREANGERGYRDRPKRRRRVVFREASRRWFCAETSVNFVPRASYPLLWYGFLLAITNDSVIRIQGTIFPSSAPPFRPFPAQQNSLSVCPFVPIC